MLPILIYEQDEHVQETVMDAVQENRLPMRLLLETDSFSQAMRCIEQTKDVLLLIAHIQRGESAGFHLAKRAQTMNRDNYVLSNIDELQVLQQSINQGLRTMGVLLRPVTKADMLPHLLRVNDDYQKLSQMGEGALVIQNGSSVHRLPFRRIHYVEASGKKLNIGLENQVVSVYGSIAAVEAQLNDMFFRCHRSFLLNMGFVHSVDFAQMLICLDGGAKIPLSRSYKQALRERLSAGDVRGGKE